MDLRHLIKTFNILNIDATESSVNVTEIAFNQHADSESYVVSDADEELLILIEFKKIVNLHSITIHSSLSSNSDNTEISAPKDIHIYKLKNININFDDIKSMSSDKSITCNVKKLKKGQRISLKQRSKTAIKFKTVQFLAIYIESNQNETENTFMNLISFKGEVDQSHGDKIMIEQASSITTVNLSNIQKLSTKTDTQQTYDFDRSSKKNTENLNKLIQEFDQSDITRSAVNSQHLLESSNIYIGQRNQNECVLSDCYGLNRICKILNRYHVYIDNKGNDSDSKLDDIYDANYSNTHLLNDYNHLLFCHSTQFEEIYNIMIKTANNNIPCNLTKCDMVRRNNRNRSIDNKHLYFVNNDHQIVRQQCIDRIHSYYFHSFDIGYKMTKSEKNDIINTEIKLDDENKDELFDVNVEAINHLIATKQESYKIIDELKRLNFSNKFKSVATYNKYEYGVRYFYWKHYENNTGLIDPAYDLANTHLHAPSANTDSMLKQWFILSKFDSLREELLFNKICTISKGNWTILLQKAQYHINTDFVREQMYCARNESSKYYDLQYQQPITINHLIAMMVYCNYDVLQMRFTETYRHLNEDETDNEMKERHRNYWHLGRLLRELVDCYGMKWSLGVIGYQIDLFHGVTTHFVFPSLNAFIKGPLSCTTDYAVSVNFCGNKGMILKLKMDTNQWKLHLNDGAMIEYENSIKAVERLNCFDCSWLSDYSNEQEIFCIGGLYKLTFDEIIEAPTGTNYSKYVRGLKQMLCFMTTGDDLRDVTNVAESMKEKQMVFRLISHEIHRICPNDPNAYPFKSCPDYFKEIVHEHCLNIRVLYFGLDDKESKVHDFIFKYDYEWIKLDLILKLFPNIETIGYTATNKDILFLQQASIYQSILDLIANNKNNSNIKFFIIKINPKYAEKMKTYINDYIDEFARYSWHIYIQIIDNVNEGTILQYFVKEKSVRIIIQHINHLNVSGTVHIRDFLNK